MTKQMQELKGGEKFTLENESYLRLHTDQWIHAIYGGNDIKPNAVRLRDGALIAIRGDAPVVVTEVEQKAG